MLKLNTSKKDTSQSEKGPSGQLRLGSLFVNVIDAKQSTCKGRSLAEGNE